MALTSMASGLLNQGSGLLNSDAWLSKAAQLRDGIGAAVYTPMAKSDKTEDAEAVLDDLDSYPIDEQIAAYRYLKSRGLSSYNPLSFLLCNSDMGEADDQLRENLDNAIESATAALDPKNLWDSWMNLYALMRHAISLGFTNSEAYEAAADQAEALGLSMDDVMDLEKVEVKDPKAIAKIQSLFDACTFRPGGIDGGEQLPPLQIQSVYQVFHEQTRAEYLLKRQQLVEDCNSRPDYTRIQVPSQNVDMSTLFGGDTPVDPNYNEFFLFHGTSDKVAALITDTDFLIKNAADNGWTFGKGVYAAEWVTHAQMFAMMGNEGEGGNSLSILVCRAFCGRCQSAGNWPATATPCSNVRTLEANIQGGVHHSTTGSEWPQSSFRCHDFILPDDDQIMPEFIVNCTW